MIFSDNYCQFTLEGKEISPNKNSWKRTKKHYIKLQGEKLGEAVRGRGGRASSATGYCPAVRPSPPVANWRRAAAQNTVMNGLVRQLKTRHDLSVTSKTRQSLFSEETTRDI